jgi:hypothetical protein
LKKTSVLFPRIGSLLRIIKNMQITLFPNSFSLFLSYFNVYVYLSYCLSVYLSSCLSTRFQRIWNLLTNTKNMQITLYWNSFCLSVLSHSLSLSVYLPISPPVFPFSFPEFQNSEQINSKYATHPFLKLWQTVAFSKPLFAND